MPLIEVLDIDSEASHDEIAARILDRHRYFSTLVVTAPTQQLRTIYERKLSDLRLLAQQYQVDLQGGQARPAAPPTAKQSGSQHAQSSNTQLPVLVLHTEGREARSYPLLPGVNILGRRQGVSGHTLVIDDGYKGRAHAVVGVVQNPVPRVMLYDIGELPGQKPSTNGVFLNGNDKRLTGKHEMRPGDTLQVGYAQLVLTYAVEGQVNEAVREVSSKGRAPTVIIKVN